MTTIICGVDVSSLHLDARIGLDGPALRCPRDAAGIAALAAFCREHQAALVVLEATGGYERLPFARIDAGLIAHFGAVKALAPQAPAHDSQRCLEALTVRLRQLTSARVAQANQRRLVEDATVLGSIDRISAALTQEIRIIEAEIDALLDADPLWRSLAQALRTIKGVAGRTVATVLAHLPEIGTLSNKAVAKLVGLAPLANDSGQRQGRRPVRGGRTPVRSLLVLVAAVVARHDPDFRLMHQRLTAAGKPKMVVRIALARKLIVRLNAIARDARRQIPITP